MKFACRLCAAFIVTGSFAAEPAVSPTLLLTRVVERSIAIQLGEGFLNVRGTPVVPTTISPGTKVRIIAKPPGDKYAPVRWFKGTTELSADGGTLEIPSATSGDTGSYRARVTEADGRSFETDQASIFVDGHEGQRLCNVSARVQLNAAQPSFSCGFVVEPGPWSVLVLVRVVGPSLAGFGVLDALAAPQLRVFDQRGQSVVPAGFPTTSVTVPVATSRVGAFPLTVGAADIAQLFYVSPGAYSAQASAPSGTSGTVLVEIYEVSAREGETP